jgi:uncharacterized protein (TIGR02246 family)
VTGELEALERRGWVALSGSDGAEFYDGLMADDGLMVFPGLVLDKASTIRAIEAAGPWSSFELSDLRVVEATPDSAVVAYRATAERPGEAYHALMTSVYARREGQWRLVLHQQTPTPEHSSGGST